MGIDWETLLGVQGAALARAYEDCVGTAYEKYAANLNCDEDGRNYLDQRQYDDCEDYRCYEADSDEYDSDEEDECADCDTDDEN